MEFQEKGARAETYRTRIKLAVRLARKKDLRQAAVILHWMRRKIARFFNRLFAHIQHPVICYLTLSVLLCFLICCYSTTIRLRCQSFFGKFSDKFSDKSFDVFSGSDSGQSFSGKRQNVRHGQARLQSKIYGCRNNRRTFF